MTKLHIPTGEMLVALRPGTLDVLTILPHEQSILKELTTSPRGSRKPFRKKAVTTAKASGLAFGSTFDGHGPKRILLNVAKKK
ncbi:hypothetical protein DVH05_025182, partial [Phytophthora capsici]